jgi:hypothetical protein
VRRSPPVERPLLAKAVELVAVLVLVVEPTQEHDRAAMLELCRNRVAERAASQARDRMLAPDPKPAVVDKPTLAVYRATTNAQPASTVPARATPASLAAKTEPAAPVAYAA